MRTHQNTNKAFSQKGTFNPHNTAAAGSSREPSRAEQNRPALSKFKIAKMYEGFHVGQVVYQFSGPTYGVDCSDEVAVTVSPHQGPFVGLPPDYLEEITN